MTLANLQVRVHPGDGLVAHFGSAILVLPGGGARELFADELLASVETICRENGPAPGRMVARGLASVVTGARPDAVISFGVVAAVEDGVAVMLCGSTEALLSGTEGGKEVLSGRDVATWVDRVVREPFDSLVVLASGATEQMLDAHTNLRSGTVTGSGVTLSRLESSRADFGLSNEATDGVLPAPPLVDPTRHSSPAADSDIVIVSGEHAAAPPPPPARQPPPAHGDSSSVFIELTPLPPEELAPLPIATEAAAEVVLAPGVPMVQGIFCSRGHFDDPRARFCAVCGISMVQQTHNQLWGPRPSLGVLVLDDGATFVVDSGYTIGREPEASPQVRDGSARPLTIEDPELRVSRIHARLLVHDWDVWIEDAQSANGTNILRPGSSTWEALVPGKPITIEPGTRIRLGGRELIYDSHFQSS